MWQARDGCRRCTSVRDDLWSHPDLIPTSEDIDDPAALVARLASGTGRDRDDVDQAIEDLLNDDRDDRPREGDDGTAEEAGPTRHTPSRAVDSRRRSSRAFGASFAA